MREAWCCLGHLVLFEKDIDRLLMQKHPASSAVMGFAYMPCNITAPLIHYTTDKFQPALTTLLLLLLYCACACLFAAACRSRPLPEFWKLVSPRATARKLFVKFTRLKVRRKKIHVHYHDISVLTRCLG